MMLQWRPELELPPEVRDFCRRLRQNDPTLEGEELVRKGVDANGAKAIAKALMINTNLKELILGGNRIGDEGAKAIAEALMINTNLEVLYLGGNQIGDEGAKAIAEAWKIHPSLEVLYLDNNQIGDEGAKAIAEALMINTNLEELILYGNLIGVEGANAIATALAAKKRPNLQGISIDVDCDDSTAKEVVRAIKEQKFPSLYQLDGVVELNKHLSELQVPQEFADKDNDEILGFLCERWESGEERLSVVKVVVTGPGSVGKTCLVTRLVENRFPENTQMTNGVDVVRNVDNSGIEYVYYDFGGQPVYATTHQLFLRTRAVFVVVWDVRSETLDFEHQPFHQYAQDILDASPEAKMIFVSTKSDQGCTRLTSDELHKLETMYQGHFLGYHHISARANSGIDGPDGLKQEITTAAKAVLQGLGGEHGLEGMMVPKTWIDLKEKLGILRDSQHKFFLSANEWDSHVQSVNIVEEERANRVLRLFHEMGEVHCLPTGQIVLDPPGLTEVLSRVVTRDHRHVENARDGYLRHKELGQVWEDWDEELHKGFLELLHECEIGYRLRDDDGTDYEATLIPAMLYRDGESMTQHVNSLASTNIELKKGPTLKVELSTRSSRFGPKLLAKLRGVTIIGGWWRNGCIVVDTGDTRDVRAFGTVSWAVDAGVMVVTVLTYGAGRLLTLKALNAVGSCLEEFPGVRLEGFDMHCGFAGCSGGWSKENILSCEADTMSCSKCGRRREVIDVKGWIMAMTTFPSVTDTGSSVEASGGHDDTDGKACALPWFSHLTKMLQSDSGASAETLCYLLLTHQKDMLTYGCGTHGRVELKVLWLIYSLTEGSKTAYPLCPHLVPESVLVRDDLGIAEVDEAGLQTMNSHQKEMNEVVRLMLSNEEMDIDPPEYGARFVGTLWHAHSKVVAAVKKTSKKQFKKVTIPEIGQVWVHESDQTYFQHTVQVSAIKELKEEVETSVQATEQLVQASVARGITQASSSSLAVDVEDIRQLEEDAFAWVAERFRDWPGRQRMKLVLDEVAIDSAIANSVKIGLRKRMTERVVDYNKFHTFYPGLIVSYSTGNRQGKDVDCAGPGLLVVVGVINLLLENGCPCYSDIMTPAGINWEKYMLRLREAKVMIVLMSETFFRSVHCLREVAAAIKCGVGLIPVRLEETSPRGIDIARDKDHMWSLEELARYAKHQPNTMRVLEELRVQRESAVQALSTIGSLPSYGTILNQEAAVDELLGRVNDFVPYNVGESTGTQEDQSFPIKKKARTLHSHSQKDAPECPTMMAISYDQLLEVRQLAASFGNRSLRPVTMRDVNELIVMPICRREGTSYAGYKNPNGCRVDAFVSHSWDEPFDEFVASIEKVFQTHVEKPNLWICAFALNQCDSETIENQLGLKESGNLENSPFVRALKGASTFVVVRNSVTDLYSRIWCVCELMYANKLGLVTQKTYVSGPDAFADSEASCIDSQATNTRDKALIFRELLSEHSYEEIDDFIRRFRQHQAPL